MASSCCNENTPNHKKSIDWLLWGSAIICLICLLGKYFFPKDLVPQLYLYFESVSLLLSKMWWGLVLGVFFVGMLSQIPREFVMKLLGDEKGIKGILRATLAGLLLDLCSHGILLIGMKLYERGASTAQTMAFLIASPWNSFSLTLILWALVGLNWTLCFIVLSAIIAIVSGIVFESLEAKNILPPNPNRTVVSNDFHFLNEAKKALKNTPFNFSLLKTITISGVKDSRMIVRWILFGALLAAIIQSFVSTEHLQSYFGSSLLGLGFTLLAATIIEVCSEGSTPIAADLLTRAQAPGNAFAFLMTGVATDYTEIIAIREQTKSWKIALYLPLVTVPQIIILAYILNQGL